MDPRTAATFGLVAIAAALGACSHPAEAEPRRTPTPHHTTSRTEAAAAGTEPTVEAAGDEVEEPPAPEAATLADGRALALPGPEGFLSTWRVIGEDEDEPDHEATVAAFDVPKMDLSEVAARNATTVTLGATLLVPRRTHAWLLQHPTP